MFPVSKERSERGDKRERLIEHDVMFGLRNLYDRRLPAQQIEHVFADFRRHQHRFLTAKDGDAALRGLEALSCVADREALPDPGIELPREARLDLLQRITRHPVEDVEIVAGLRRHQPEAGKRSGERWIDVVRLGFAFGRTTWPIGWIDRRIDDHRSSKAMAIETARQHGDE